MGRSTKDLGDGPPCPEPGADHNLYVSSRRRLWCPVTQSIYGPATYSEESRTFVAGPLIRPGDREHLLDGTSRSRPVFDAELQKAS